MGQVLEIIAGFDRTWSSTLYNAGVALSYPSGATLDATVSVGGQEASLFSPAVDWISSTAGTYTLSIAASQTATLMPGEYQLIVGVSYSGSHVVAFDGGLRVLESVGDATLRIPYVSDSDLQQWYDQLDTLANKANDLTGFLSVRCSESDRHDRRIINRYVGLTSYVKVRQTTRDPILGTYDVPSATAVGPDRTALTNALIAGGLIVDPVAREILCKRCIAEILDRQEVSGRDSYRDEAMAMRARADELWRCYQAQVSLASPPTATATHLFDADVTLLPEGTSP